MAIDAGMFLPDPFACFNRCCKPFRVRRRVDNIKMTLCRQHDKHDEKEDARRAAEKAQAKADALAAQASSPSEDHGE